MVVVATAAMSTGCKKDRAIEVKIPSVTVSKPIKTEIIDYVDFTGRTDAVEAVDVYCYPMVTGFLDRLSLPYTEGAMVQKDQVLFQIDSQPYQLAVNKALETLDSTTASLKLANVVLDNALNANRSFPNTVAKQEVDQDRVAVDNANSALEVAKANLAIAQYNLGKTTVTAPISGQISRYYYTPGNLVTSSVKLTTIVSVNPMYVYFDVDEPTRLRLNAETEKERSALTDPEKKDTFDPDFTKRLNIAQHFHLLQQVIVRNQITPVQMSVPGNKGPMRKKRPEDKNTASTSADVGQDDDYWYEGEINFVNNQVNSSTGSISMRGVFKNDEPFLAGGIKGERLLKPGMFVRVRLPIGGKHPALLIDDKAIGSDQGNKFVWVVVDADGKKVAQKRRIETGQLQGGGLREVKAYDPKTRTGIKPDEDIIVEGSLKAEEGKEVKATVKAPRASDPKPSEPKANDAQATEPKATTPKPQASTPKPDVTTPKPSELKPEEQEKK
jgi:multidrug efflux system membrane fusion protein